MVQLVQVGKVCVKSRWGSLEMFAKAIGRASKLRSVEATRGREEREDKVGRERDDRAQGEKKKAIPRGGKVLLLKRKGGS